MARTLPALSVAAALAAFATLMAVAMARAGWVFEYPLDDVYIHLAMAEQIRAGGYGVNPGEIASAASSPLYPLLLMWFPGTEIQRMLPLLWNIAGLGLAAWLWGRILVVSGYGDGALRPVGLIAAALGPVALNMFGVAFTGMEHALHVAATLAIVLGLLRLEAEERVPLILFAGCFFTTALRLEGLALGLLAALVLWRVRGFGPAALAATLTLLPALAFVGTLTALGLDPLPESVQAKLSNEDTTDFGPVTRTIAQVQVNIGKGGGFLLLLGCGALGLLLFANPRLRAVLPRSVALALLLAGIAHLMFGQIGWMDRYEGYIWAGLAAGIVAFAIGGPRRLPALAVIGVLGAGATTYWQSWTEHFPWNIRGIHLQPVQSARFAKEFARVPVAVNDLGAASWANPNYVLDLWGLASAEARFKRIFDPTPGWADPLAEARGVQLAMIYEDWLEAAIGPDWVKLGELRLDIRRGYLGGAEVAYFATDPAHVESLAAALRAWAPTLPEGAFFVFEDGVE